MAQGRRRFIFLALPITLAVAHACNSPVAGGDSESHFLADCVATCSNGLSCVCGVCTRPCTATDECTTVSARAECATVLEPACAATGKMCDVACLSDDACTSLGKRYGCVGGRCRSTAGARDASAVVVHDGSPVSAGGSGGGGDGGAGGSPGSPGVDATPTVSGACGHATFPAPPAPGGTPGGNIEIVAVQSSVDFGDSEPSPSLPPTRYLGIGFDLDNRCTLLSDLKTNAECHIPSYAHGAVDGADGRDNAFGGFVQFMRDVMGNFSSESFSQQLRQGVTNLIVHVEGYNGEVNDDQVVTTMLVSAPFDSPPRAKGTAPHWDGSDVWPVASDSLIGNSTPRFVDANSYVSGGKLVVTLPVADLRFVVGLSTAVTVNLDLVLHGTYLVCDVGRTTVGHWGYMMKTCTLGGRLVADDLVHQISHFGDPAFNGQPLCTNSNLYPTFKANICGLIDVSNNGFASPGTDCDSLSLGLSFDTEPALIGNVFTVSPVGEHCPPGSQPSTDSCAGSAADAGH
jgi:hypothetical protein